MPTLVRQPAQRRQPTGIRLIDDLIGDDAAQAPPTERQATTLRAPTTYESHVQPAILALRKLVKPAYDFIDPNNDPLGGMSPVPLAGPVASVVGKTGSRIASAGAHSMQGAMDAALKGMRSAATEGVEHVTDDVARVANNASGESAASMEAMGRRAWEKSTGRQLVRRDRAGRTTPFIGEPGDTRVNPGEAVGYLYPDGRFETISGGR